MRPPPVAAIYCWVSTGAQGAEGTSLASQEALCRAHAAARGDTREPVRPLTIS